MGSGYYSPLHQPDGTVMDAFGERVHMLVEVTVFRSTAASSNVSSARGGPEAGKARDRRCLNGRS
eukprot:6652544-Pyramimonas_sp.AAC.1